MLDQFGEFLGRQIDISQNRSNEGPAQIAARVVGHSRRPAICVPIEDVAPLLADGGKSESQQRLFHCFGVDDRQTGHPFTVICWMPTKGCASIGSPFLDRSSKLNSSTSRRLCCSSSRVGPWL